MAIARTTLTTGNSATYVTATATASITAAAGSMVLLTICNFNQTGASAPIPSKNGLGLTWSAAASYAPGYSTDLRIGTYYAQVGSSDVTGTINIGVSQAGLIYWEVEQVTGHDPARPIGGTGSGSGQNVSALTVNLLSATPNGVGSRPFLASGRFGGSNYAGGANMTVIANAALQLSWRSDAYQQSLSTGAAITAPSSAVAIGFEIQAATDIHRVTLTSGFGGGGTTSAVTASVSPAPNTLLAVSVLTVLTSGTAPDPSISGLGLAWTKQTTIVEPGNHQRITWFTAQCGTSPGSGALTFTFPVAPDSHAIWDVEQVSGHNPTAPVAQTATAAFALVPNGSALGVTFTKAPTSSRNRHFAAYATAGWAATPKFPFTELVDIVSSYSMETMWRSDVFDASSSSTPAGGPTSMAGAALEVAAAPNPNSPLDVYLLTSGSGASSGGVNTTASISPVPNSTVYFMARGGQATAPTAFSGLGATWTQLAHVLSSDAYNRTVVYRAKLGASPGSGPLTITWSTTSTYWDVVQVTGNDPNASPPERVTTNSSASGTSLSVAMPAARDSLSRPMALFTHAANFTGHRAGWTTLNAGGVEGVDVRMDAFDTPATATTDASGAWIAVGIELYGDPGIVPKSDADTGTFADAESLTTAASDADTGTLVDAQSLTTDSSDADTVSVIEGEVISVQVFDGDAISFVEGETAEIATVPVSDADTAAFTEVELVEVAPLGSADTITFTESELVQYPLSSADSGTFSEAELVQVPLASAEIGLIAEAESVTAAAADADAMSWVEAEQVELSFFGDDTGVFAEAEDIEVTEATLPAGLKVATLTDEFGGDFLDASKWTVVSGTVDVAGGQLRMTPGASPTTIQSLLIYDARDSELVVRGVSEGPTVRVTLSLSEPGGDLDIILIRDDLTFRIDNGGVPDDLTVAYDPDTDVYWRIRESVGQVLFDTSPTGISGSWTTRRQAPHNLNLTGVRVTLSVAGYGVGSWGHGPWGYTSYGVAYPTEGVLV